MAVTWTDIFPGGSSGSPVLIGRSSTQGLTETGTPNTGDGIPLAGLGWVQPVLIAPSSQTFTGVGNTRGWYFGDTVYFSGAAWARFPRSDDTLTDYANQSIIYLPALQITSTGGRFSLQVDSVGVSGGTTLTLLLLGYPPSLVRMR